jgi:flagellar biosynthesis/type III secretory pathway chaperone
MAAAMANGAPPLDKLIEALQGLLEEERQALLSGAPAAIEAAAQRKLALAETIEAATAAPGASPPPRAALTALARTNQENAVICAAMLRHLGAAIDRLRGLDQHRSYTADGGERSPGAQHALGAA